MAHARWSVSPEPIEYARPDGVTAPAPRDLTITHAMRSRPDVDIKVPKRVLPGETLHVHLVVTGLSVTPIDFIAVHFHVAEGTRSGEEGVFVQRAILHETVNVAEEGELGAEVYRYHASFEVPPELPPTYFGSAFEHRAWVEIHVSIPWWPDVLERYDVAILPVPIARPAPTPFTGSSARENGAFVEVSLRTQSFAPGDTIVGALAFGNLGSSTVQDIEPALVGVERLGLTDAGGYVVHRHPSFLDASRAIEGREIPFRLAVPASATPSFAVAAGTLSWFFEVHLSLGGAPDVRYRVPVTIAAFEGPALVASAEPARIGTEPAPIDAEPAPIGADRWRAVWASVSRASGLALDSRKLRLTGEISGCDVSVRVGKTETKEPSLVARLRFRGLGLGLSIANGGLLHAGTYFPADEAERRFRITGRDPAQIRDGLSLSLRGALLAFDEATIGDDQADVCSNVLGYEQRWLSAFLDQITALAQGIEETSRSIPPPAPMAMFLPAWQRFASDLDADLTPGNMEISGGMFEGAIVEIRTELEGKTPTATTIALVIDPPIEVAVDLGSAEAIQHLPAPAREILRSIEALCRPLLEASGPLPPPAKMPRSELREAQISLRLPAVIADPSSLRDVMTALLSLAAALRGDRRAGPYR
ncbi:MAG: hypothetical protein ACMG6S_09065 [Byssovorax sp.]